MAKLYDDIKEELSKFTSSKTIDALIAPSLYVVSNMFLGLKLSIAIALVNAFSISAYRLYKKERYIYALTGMIGVIIASSFAYFADNAANYFLPKVISSALLFTVSVVSIIIGKPLAAIVSHLSRGWELEWYYRKDIKAAYREVTILWSILLLVRFIVQIMLLRRANILELGWANIILGFPATTSVLILSLIYGSFRLKKLKGPGIDEFRNGKKPPWKGQGKGF